LVGCDPRTRNIDVTKIEAAITSKTRAIVPVHLYGLTANMPEVARIAKAHNLFVVEDCAQGIGAKGDRFAVGELSDAVCLSFIIQKNLGCFGDGGAVATNNKDLAADIRKLRNHGSVKRSHHSIGYNSRLDDIHAAVLRVKLKRVDEWSERRRKIAKLYDQGLADASMTLPFTPPGYEHVYHPYVVDSDERDALQAYLQSTGITALTHYPIAIHQQKGFPLGTSRAGRFSAGRGEVRRQRFVAPYVSRAHQSGSRARDRSSLALGREPGGAGPGGVITALLIAWQSH